jgi:hypothetical protein
MKKHILSALDAEKPEHKSAPARKVTRPDRPTVEAIG